MLSGITFPFSLMWQMLLQMLSNFPNVKQLSSGKLWDPFHFAEIALRGICHLNFGSDAWVHPPF
jgi:hypothetical protein